MKGSIVRRRCSGVSRVGTVVALVAVVAALTAANNPVEAQSCSAASVTCTSSSQLVAVGPITSKDTCAAACKVCNGADSYICPDLSYKTGSLGAPDAGSSKNGTAAGGTNATTSGNSTTTNTTATSSSNSTGSNSTNSDGPSEIAAFYQCQCSKADSSGSCASSSDLRALCTDPGFTASSTKSSGADRAWCGSSHFSWLVTAAALITTTTMVGMFL
jgi:hypothetical protein